jgi:hypothetical protein
MEAIKMDNWIEHRVCRVGGADVDGFRSLDEARRFAEAAVSDFGGKYYVQRWVDFDASPDGWQTVFAKEVA